MPVADAEGKSSEVRHGQNTVPSGFVPGRNGGALRPPWQPGEVPNPGGRPKLDRTPASAYAELLGTPGGTIAAIVKAYRAKRGKAFCGADLAAIGMLRTYASSTNPSQTRAAVEITDRVCGKVEQPHALRQQETEALIRALAESTGIDPAAIRALGEKLGGSS